MEYPIDVQIFLNTIKDKIKPLDENQVFFSLCKHTVNFLLEGYAKDSLNEIEKKLVYTRYLYRRRGERKEDATIRRNLFKYFFLKKPIYSKEAEEFFKDHLQFSLKIYREIDLFSKKETYLCSAKNMRFKTYILIQDRNLEDKVKLIIKEFIPIYMQFRFIVYEKEL